MEKRTAPPVPKEDYEVIEETEIGFRVKHKVNGETYRCAIGWNGKANWFKELGYAYQKGG